MNDFKILKCPACGASLVQVQSESILTCSHCGTNLIAKDTTNGKQENFNRLKSDNSLIKKLLITVIILMAVLGAGMFWYSKKLSKQKTPNDDVEVIYNQNAIGNTNSIVKKPLSSIPTLNTQAMGVNKNTIDQNKGTLKLPKLSFVSQVEGETIIGGKYWIVTVRNDSKSQVVRPRVVVSLFDQNKQRIGEYTGWSKLDTLDVNSETTILVLISEPPKVEYTSEMQAIAALSNQFATQLIPIKVDSYIVTPKNNSEKKVTIIGDVSNPNEFRVDYIRVQAIARNKQGIAIGIADAFVTNSSLAENEKSGFQIKVSTFITEPAESWSLWASGRKHRNK